MTTKKRLIDANKCPCNTCRTQYCGDPHRCTNFMMWLHYHREDAVEVVHGWWIESEAMSPLTFKCSECKGWVVKHSINERNFMYCPHCGAKMDGDRKDNERKAD